MDDLESKWQKQRQELQEFMGIVPTGTPYAVRQKSGLPILPSEIIYDPYKEQVVTSPVPHWPQQWYDPKGDLKPWVEDIINEYNSANAQSRAHTKNLNLWDYILNNQAEIPLNKVNSNEDLMQMLRGSEKFKKHWSDVTRQIDERLPNK